MPYRAEADVLVVGADSDHGFLAAAIRAGGLTTDVAGDVIDAIRLLARSTYRVLVLDLVLPDGTGIDVLDYIETERLPKPLIVITADADTSPLMSSIDPKLVQRVRFKPLSVPSVAALVLTLADVSDSKLDTDALKSG